MIYIGDPEAVAVVEEGIVVKITKERFFEVVGAARAVEERKWRQCPLCLGRMVIDGNEESRRRGQHCVCGYFMGYDYHKCDGYFPVGTIMVWEDEGLD